MVASNMQYADAIALKNTCSTLYTAMNLPTIHSFFIEPKWFTNIQIKKTLSGLLKGDPTRQPCHLCKRFLPQDDFAADQCLDNKFLPGVYNGSKHHFQCWCLQCGLAAGFYSPGQYFMYRSPFSGIVRGKFCMCGLILRVYTSCGPDGTCSKSVGDQPRPGVR